MATVKHPRSPYEQVVSHLAPDRYAGSGRRTFFEYRDLGIETATGGDFDVHAVHAKAGEHVTTGWHYHTGTVQVVYCLNGWEELAFEDGSTVRLLPGS
ncbi:MAG TPA: cupin, partial [Chloroflexota bacterium]|nr:cupin [Chloroflexota bacterium]